MCEIYLPYESRGVLYIRLRSLIVSINSTVIQTDLLIFKKNFGFR